MATDKLGDIYYGALRERQSVLDSAFDAVTEAKARYALAVREYAAARDLIMDVYDGSPYQKGGNRSRGQKLDSGKFRYIFMDAGVAAREVLWEVWDTGQPMTLEDIVGHLENGGFGREYDVEPMTDKRRVSAALMRTSGIDSMGDGTYKAEPEVSQIARLTGT